MSSVFVNGCSIDEPIASNICSALYDGDMESFREAHSIGTRTMYVNSNIALSDGSGFVGTEGVRTIPNLYQAITDISRMCSSADKGLYVSSKELLVAETVDGIKNHGDDPRDIVTLKPCAFNKRTHYATDKRNREVIFNIDANDIYFTIDNPRGKLEALPLYVDENSKTITVKDITCSWLNKCIDKESIEVISRLMYEDGLTDDDSLSIYFLPLGLQYTGIIECADGSSRLVSGINGKLVGVRNNGVAIDVIPNYVTTGYEPIPIDMVYRVEEDEKRDVTGNALCTPVSLKTIRYPVKQPYSLRSIIDAIEELNKRTGGDEDEDIVLD